jgi:hypothetical protein
MRVIEYAYERCSVKPGGFMSQDQHSKCLQGRASAAFLLSLRMEEVSLLTARRIRCALSEIC